MSDQYAQADDVLSAVGGTVGGDTELAERLIARASTKMDEYFRRFKVDADQIPQDALMECCCEMVEPYLTNAVGSDYGETIEYTTTAGSDMRVPWSWRQVFASYSTSPRIGIGTI